MHFTDFKQRLISDYALPTSSETKSRTGYSTYITQKQLANRILADKTKRLVSAQPTSTYSVNYPTETHEFLKSSPLKRTYLIKPKEIKRDEEEMI